jgi:peptidoglycan/LPS O-acetylase OafA/YrhL
MNERGRGTGRITALDGLRGISIILVIIGHLAMNRYGSPPYPDYPNVFLVFASWGVELFFVISGFIITKIALTEYQSTDTFSITSFYVRRLFRIVPPFYLYLLVILSLAGAGAIVEPRSSILQSATFTCNVTDSGCQWFTRHTWTLSYEEQFYVVFPFIFYFFRRKFSRFIIYLSAFLLLLPTVQNLLHLNGAWHVAALLAPKFSFIAVGSLIASHGGSFRRLATGRYAAAIWCVVVILLGISMVLNANFYPIQMKWSYRIGNILLPLCFAWIVGTAALLEGGKLFRLLNNPVLQFIGMISYSLYIWQQFFTGAPMYYSQNSWLLDFPMMFVVATLSYYFIERSSIRLGRRIIAVRAAGRPRLARETRRL